MATASFPADDPLCLLGEDYFDGPGEGLWVPLVPGDEPDRWDAPDEGGPVLFNGFSELDRDAAARDERFRDGSGEGVARDGGWHAALAGDSASRVGNRASIRDGVDRDGTSAGGGPGLGGERCARTGQEWPDDPRRTAVSEGWPGGETGEPGCADPGGGFGPGGQAEVMPAGWRLHALVEQAVAGGLSGMPDDAVVGVVAAARRLRSHAELLEVRATREFAHRRWESSAGPERGKDGRWLFKGRDAEFAADELAFELVESPLVVQERMDLSLALRDRLPGLDARLGHGVDLHRCRIVHEVTEALSDEHARQVDALLAGEAAGLRYDALRRRARKLAMMADPDAERERRDRATRKKARVAVFPESSGNYAIAGRELPIEEVLASRAYIRAVALELRAGGVTGSMRELDLMVFLDLTQGRDPRDRIPGRDTASTPGHGAGGTAGCGTGSSPGASAPAMRSHATSGTPAASDDSAACNDPVAGGGPRAADEPDAPYGDDARIGQDGQWPRSAGPSDAFGNVDDSAGPAGDYIPARDPAGLIGDSLSARDPAGPAGDYLAAREHDDAEADGEGDDEDDHDGLNGSGGGGSWPYSPPGPGKPGGRAAVPAKINLLVPVGTLLGWSDMPGEAGRDIIDPRTLLDLVQACSHHPATRWCVTITGPDGTAAAHGCARGQHPWAPPPGPQSSSRAQDGAPAAAQFGHLSQLLARLNAAFEPIAKNACDHRHREDRYRPSRLLQDLVRARGATCPAPGCEASSAHSDLDHTEHWPHGSTCQCNLGAPCRHHHRAKQAPGWTLEQPEPGFFRWKTPSGRIYHTSPTKFDV